MELLIILNAFRSAGFLVQQVLIEKSRDDCFLVCDEEINFADTIGYIDIYTAKVSQKTYLYFQNCVSYKSNDRILKIPFKIDENLQYLYNIKDIYARISRVNNNLSFLIYRVKVGPPSFFKKFLSTWMIVFPKEAKAPMKTFRNTKKELSRSFKSHDGGNYSIFGL